MEILGVGPLELLFVLIIALIVMGPNDMAKAGRTIGRLLRRIVMSPTWRAVQETSRGLRQLPTYLMREAGLEQEIAELQQTQQELRDQVAEVQKVGAMFGNAAEALKREARSLRSETATNLGAWTTPAASEPTIQPPPASAADKTIIEEAPSASIDEGFSANNPNPSSDQTASESDSTAI